MQVTKHVPPPVEVPPPTYTIEGLTEDEFITIREGLYQLYASDRVFTAGMSARAGKMYDAMIRGKKTVTNP